MQANEITVINETVILKYFHWFRHACAVSFLTVISFFRTSLGEWNGLLQSPPVQSVPPNLWSAKWTARAGKPDKRQKKIFFTSQTSTKQTIFQTMNLRLCIFAVTTKLINANLRGSVRNLNDDSTDHAQACDPTKANLLDFEGKFLYVAA